MTKHVSPRRKTDALRALRVMLRKAKALHARAFQVALTQAVANQGNGQ